MEDSAYKRKLKLYFDFKFRLIQKLESNLREKVKKIKYNKSKLKDF